MCASCQLTPHVKHELYTLRRVSMVGTSWIGPPWDFSLLGSKLGIGMKWLMVSQSQHKTDRQRFTIKGRNVRSSSRVELRREDGFQTRGEKNQNWTERITQDEKRHRLTDTISSKTGLNQPIRIQSNTIWYGDEFDPRNWTKKFNHNWIKSKE